MYIYAYFLRIVLEHVGKELWICWIKSNNVAISFLLQDNLYNRNTTWRCSAKMFMTQSWSNLMNKPKGLVYQIRSSWVQYELSGVCKQTPLCLSYVMSHGCLLRLYLFDVKRNVFLAYFAPLKILFPNIEKF